MIRELLAAPFVHRVSSAGAAQGGRWSNSMNSNLQEWLWLREQGQVGAVSSIFV
jgi:hypothetical protein